MSMVCWPTLQYWTHGQHKILHFVFERNSVLVGTNDTQAPIVCWQNNDGQRGDNMLACVLQP